MSSSGAPVVVGAAVVVSATVVVGAAVVVSATVVVGAAVVVVAAGAAVSELPPQADAANRTVTNTPSRFMNPSLSLPYAGGGGDIGAPRCRYAQPTVAIRKIRSAQTCRSPVSERLVPHMFGPSEPVPRPLLQY